MGQVQEVARLQHHPPDWNPTLGYEGQGHPTCNNDELNGSHRKDKKVDIASVNCTSWGSLVNALKLGVFSDCHVIAIQEHHIVASNALVKAATQAQQLGWCSHFTQAVATTKGGSSAGVGFLWLKSIPVSNIAVHANTPRSCSIDVNIGDLGYVTIFSVYGFDSGHSEHMQHTSNIISEINSKCCTFRVPFIILGDFNMEPHELIESISSVPIRCRVIQGGETCFTKSRAATLDYALVSSHFGSIAIQGTTLSTTIPTHRPFVLTIKAGHKKVKVKALQLQAKANTIKVFGPSLCMQHDWKQWHQAASKLKEETSFETDPHVGKFRSNLPFCNKVDLLWEQWVHIAAKEIRANYAIEDERIGLPFSIQDTTLLAHFKQKTPELTQKLDASRWALRRTQEALARWARSTMTMGQLKNNALKNAKALIELEDKSLVHFGQSLAQDLVQDATNPSTSTLRILKAWVQLIRMHIDDLAKQDRSNNRDKWQAHAKK